nr:putative lipoyltransferase 2, mitochondrial isoform X1 [Procambarus clarkii]XP_045594697.1 putative lipoyltransferase 2, mitochondrial isoform X1 [Procambarus clarkii]
MPRHSRVQQEVLHLYKQCLRAAEKKPGFYNSVQHEFRKNSAVPKTDILRIEHLLRQGWRKLKMMQDPFVNVRSAKPALKMASNIIHVEKLGCLRYLPVWNYQKTIAERIAKNVKDGKTPGHTLLLVEHKPVYTTGLREYEYTAEVEARLKSTGADFHHTNRGGLITFHGPGQLTVYPILHLKSFNSGIKWYVCALERTVIRTLQLLGITGAHTTPHTGVWVGENKLCAIGIQGRHITTHGLALNCNVDLKWYDHIVPCGLDDKGTTSVSKELNRDVTVDEVEPYFLKSFSEVFQCKLVLAADEFVME